MLKTVLSIAGHNVKGAHGMCKIDEVTEETDPTTDAIVSQLARMLATLPPEKRIGTALSMSAKLLEFAAFESATRISSNDVGALIDWAAQISRCSHGFDVRAGAMSADEAPRLN